MENEWRQRTILVLNWTSGSWEEPETFWQGNLPDPPDTILSPLQYFKIFIDDDIINNFVYQTNLYATQETGKGVDVTHSEMEQFLSIQMFMSIIKMPKYRMFWSEKSRFSTVANTMARNHFDKLRTYFHLNDNSNILPRTHIDHDKLFKIRPFINAVRKNMNKIKFEEFSAVDEIIIPFKGRSFMKQYNKNKL